MKIKALLVDDEAPILRHLQAAIPWEAMDIDVVGTARNGEQALEIAIRERPHLILCDIRMPVMDGIRFLERLREFDSEAEVIMLTGYPDFGYVRTVIRHEVRDYILKPIDYEELAHTVERIAGGIRARSEERMARQREWRQMHRLAYEKALYDLLADLDGEASRSFIRMHEESGGGTAFAMMLADVEDYPQKEHAWNVKERKLWNFATQNVLQESLESLGVHHSVFQIRSGEWCVLIERTLPETFDRQEVIAWAGRLREAIVGHLKLGIRLAVHPAPVSAERLARTYKALQRLLNLTPAAESVLVTETSRGGREASSHKLWDWIEEMVTGLKRCDRMRTEAALRELNDSFRRLPDDSAERAEPILHYLCLHLLREMKGMDVLDRGEETELWRLLDRNPGIRETLAAINRLVDTSLDSAMKKKTSDVLMLSARDYIERHLSSDLSIDMLADYLGISNSYFSLLFKQHFKETFVEYVTKQRMEMAKSLLALSDKSVAQVGQMVGFAERRYFSRVFSKYTGMLPSEYRERRQQGSGETAFTLS